MAMRTTHSLLSRCRRSCFVPSPCLCAAAVTPDIRPSLGQFLTAASRLSDDNIMPWSDVKSRALRLKRLRPNPRIPQENTTPATVPEPRGSILLSLRPPCKIFHHQRVEEVRSQLPHPVLILRGVKSTRKMPAATCSRDPASIPTMSCSRLIDALMFVELMPRRVLY